MADMETGDILDLGDQIAARAEALNPDEDEQCMTCGRPTDSHKTGCPRDPFRKRRSIFTEPAVTTEKVYATLNQRDGDLYAAVGGTDLDRHYRTTAFTLNFADDSIEVIVRYLPEHDMTVLIVSEMGRPLIARAYPGIDTLRDIF